MARTNRDTFFESVAEKIVSKYLTGVATLKDRLIILLDVAKVLSEEELVKLSKITGKHSRKIKSQMKPGEEHEIVELDELKTPKVKHKPVEPTVAAEPGVTRQPLDEHTIAVTTGGNPELTMEGSDALQNSEKDKEGTS